jgi:cytochrome c-type biogenesis protein CcsB
VGSRHALRVSVPLAAVEGIHDSFRNALDNTSFLLLFVTMLIYWGGAAFPGIPYLQVLGTAGVGIANLCIAALLGARWLEAGYFPLSNLYESLFFLAWGITAMHLVAEYISRSRLVGVATTPVAMGVTAFAALSLPPEMQSSAPLVPALKSNWLMMHVSVMMLSYATLMVGALLSIAFLIVTRGQKIELRGSSVGTGGYRLDRSLAKVEASNSEAIENGSQNSLKNISRWYLLWLV